MRGGESKSPSCPILLRRLIASEPPQVLPHRFKLGAFSGPNYSSPSGPEAWGSRPKKNPVGETFATPGVDSFSHSFRPWFFSETGSTRFPNLWMAS